MHREPSGAVLAEIRPISCAGSKHHFLAQTLLVCSLVLSGCAASVTALPVSFSPIQTGGPAEEIRIGQTVSVRLDTGYSRALPAGSRWLAVGTIPHGTVYRPVGTVFSIEGRHVHEAYLVVRDGALRGFYLPAESRFTPLQEILSLSL